MAVGVSLEVMSGERTGSRHTAPPGSPLRVGRVAPAEVLILDDPLLSALHFAIECNGAECRIKDLGSRFGTFRRGEQVSDADLIDGDTILAGRTRFAVALTKDGFVVPTVDLAQTPAPVFPLPAATPAPRPPARTELRDWFSGLPEPLFAVLDAAREPTIPERIANSGEEFHSLFDGDRGKELAPFGPWLVRIRAGSKLLDELLAEGWGQSWGVYLTCSQPILEVRKQLRRFLMVKLPDGRQVFFRYYDPRVLRTYLQTCTAAEVTAFFGPIGQYIAESSDVGNVLVFTPTYKDWRKMELMRVPA